MKKVFYSVAIVLLALSCVREEPKDEGASQVFSAIIPETKTALGEKSGGAYPNYWAVGDMISVNGVSSDALEASHGAGTKEAEFSVAGVSAPYNYVYPAGAVSSYTAGTASITIPTEQAYVEDSYDPAAWIMVGSGSDVKLAFSSAMALLKITPTAPATGSLQVASVKVEAVGSEKISGAFTTDFATISAAEGAVGYASVTPSAAIGFGTPVIVAIPAQTYADGMRITITASDNSFMVITRPGSWDVLANKLYTVNTPAYTANADVLPLAVGTVSSSSISYVWGAGTYKGAYGHDYTAALYTDPTCETLVVSYTIPASAEVWGIEDGDVYPTFSFGGLAPSTSYYCKVTDNTTEAESAVVEGVTSAFTVVDPASVTGAAAGDVILAEDFSEIGWGPDEFGNAAGFVPNPKALGTPSGVNPAGSFYSYKSTSAGRIFDDSVTPMTASDRLHEWGFQGGNSVYIRNGYLRCSTTSNRTHVVTPALSGIPAGKYATIDVTVTAAKHEESTNDVAVFVAPEDAAKDGYKYSGISLSEGAALGIASSRIWETKTVRIANVASGSKLAIGSLENVSKLNRFSLSDVTVELVDVYDTPVTFDIDASLIGASSSSLAFGWEDNTRDYVAALYSDIDCTSLVASFEIPADENYWVKGSNAQASPWNGGDPKFVFSGLAPATTYYFKVTSGTLTSDVVQATTSDFTVVDATGVSDASVGDVILAEDFSEIGWGSDELFGASGFYPSTKALWAPSGAYTVADGNYHIANANNVRLYDITTIESTDRLSAWGFLGNSATYAYAGYLRVGAASAGNRTHVVSPALAGIPDGKKATIDVTVTSSKYESSSNDVAVFAEAGLGSTDLSKGGHKFSGASLSDGYALGASVKSWTTKTVRIKNVTNGHHLIFGSLENVDTKNRFLINDVVVTIVEIKTPGAIEEVIEINDFASFKAFLEACNEGLTVQGNVNANISLSSAQEEEIASLYPVDFEGVVNGNGFTISGLAKPLFDDLTGSVSNLTLQSGLDIAAADGNVGSFAKNADGASLTNCIATGTLNLSDAVEVTGDLYAGGLVGTASSSSFDGCGNQMAISSAAGVSSVLGLGGIAGRLDASALLSCFNKGTVLNAGNAAVLAVGGLVGRSSGATSYSNACYNYGAITNNGTGASTEDNIDARIGGLIGWADGAVTFAGSGSEYNYNDGPIQENSPTAHVAISGICGYSTDTASDFSYAKNLENGDISITEGVYEQLWIGGILGEAVSTTIDHTSNAGDILFTGVTVSGQVFCGGIIGRWSDTETKVVQYCHNTGRITTAGHALGSTKDLLPTKYECAFSYFGGICGGGASECQGKTFQYCSCEYDGNMIDIYTPIRSRVGGISSTCRTAPNNCTVKANIRYKRAKVAAVFQEEGAANPGTKDYSQVGGIIGFANGAKSFENLYFKGTIDTNGGGMGNGSGQQGTFTAGLIGMPNTNSTTYTFKSCCVGGTVYGYSSNDTDNYRCRLFIAGNKTTPTATFPGCVIETGTERKAKTTTTVNTAEDVAIGVCAANAFSLADGGVLPSVDSVSWPSIPYTE